MTSGVDKRLLVPGLVFAAMTVSVMTTLGAPLIPLISADQGVPLEAAQWSMTITLLVGAVATPVIGRLGDGAQRSRVLAATLATMAAGSVLAATAPTFELLVVGRALQGVGYGIVPLAIAIAREHVARPRRGDAITTISITVAVGSGLGFPITGLVAQVFDYRAAFWFGALFSCVALLVVLAIVPRAAPASRRVSLDLPGAVLCGLGLGTVLLGITRASTWGWTSGRVLALFAAAALAFAAWVAVERRTAEPMIDLRLVCRPAIAAANVIGLLMTTAMFGGLALVNLLAQTPESTGYGFGATVAVTGLLLVPFSLGTVVSQTLLRLLGRRLGLRSVLLVGAGVVAVAELGLATWHGHLWELAITTALLGVGVGTTLAAMPALIVPHVPRDRTGSAMSTNQVMRTAGGALGSALSVSVLTAHTLPAAGHPAEAGYTAAFLVLASAAALAVVTILLLVPEPRPASAPRKAGSRRSEQPAMMTASSSE